MTENVLKKIVAFVLVVFLLLGVLFGTQIMTFIFGNLGQAGSSVFTPDSNSQTNVTGAFFNTTGFTIAEASNSNFDGGVAVTQAFNDTSDLLIGAGNYTVIAATGIVTNATVTTWNNVSISYTWNSKSDAEVSSDSVTNNSLNAVVTYTEQADTQLNTSAIAITLLILIALFLVFWVAFIRPMMKQTGGAKGGNFA